MYLIHLQDRKNDQVETTNNKYAAANHHSHNSRQRRRLRTDSNDQSNSLDGNDAQYQEYQGNIQQLHPRLTREC